MKVFDQFMDYSQVYRFEARIGNQSLWFITKRGIPDWNQITPSMKLILQSTAIKPDAQIAYFGCGHGAAAAALYRQYNPSKIWLMDINFIALEMSTQTFKENNLPDPEILDPVIIPEGLYHALDYVVIDIPKGRKLARRWLAIADLILKDGGILLVSGPKNLGIHSIIQDGNSLFSQSNILAYKKGNRIAKLTKSSTDQKKPNWLAEPGIALGTWLDFNVIINSHSLAISSLPGIFSYDHIDPGTKFLLDEIILIPGAKVLDVGCGYGIIGLAASIRGASWVEMVDNNLLSITSSNLNITTNHIFNARTFPSDGLSAVQGKIYDQILTNPPFHTGRSVDYPMAQALIAQSYQALEPSGELWLVSNRFIPYESLLAGFFSSVSVLAENNQYKIILAAK